MKKGTRCGEIMKVKRLVAVDNIKTANAMLKGGWVLVNSYSIGRGNTFYTMGFIGRKQKLIEKRRNLKKNRVNIRKTHINIHNRDFDN